MKKHRRWMLALMGVFVLLFLLFAGKESSIWRAKLLVAVRGEALGRAAEAALSSGETVKTRDLLGTRHYNVWTVGADASPYKRNRVITKADVPCFLPHRQ